jgi:ring-1,2-phenylacetyl-CoA epoxidase subunit PaaD
MSEVNHIISFPDLKKVMTLLEGIPDPEVPVLNIIDLGIVRDVRVYPAPAEENSHVSDVSGHGQADKGSPLDDSPLFLTIGDPYNGDPFGAHPYNGGALNAHFQMERLGLGVTVVITPTYVGCPAIDMIKATIHMTLTSSGYYPVEVRTTLVPAWTTDWLSEEAKGKLEAFGIAPPNPIPSVCHLEAFQKEEAVRCPHCQSFHTELISSFGSTPCKAMYRCLDCQEPFDYFKCH